MSEVVDVLGEHGTIEAELFVQFGNGRRIGCDPALREQQFGGIAGHEADGEEHDRGDGPDKQDCNADPSGEPRHRERCDQNQ